MAEAVVGVVLENLSSLIQKELGLFLGFDEDLKSLASLLTTIKATLEDAEERQFSDRPIKDWMQKLKDAAYVLDDILDECATEAMVLEHRGFQCGPSHKVQSSCLSSFHPKHLAFRYKIAKKMKSIRERLDDIAEERSKFHLTEMVRDRGTRFLDWRQTTSIINTHEHPVYGRDVEKNEIVDFLVGDAADYEDLLVYPIVGLGGLGKTTLAQLIYNHGKVVNHFELRIWVCVSEDFSLKRMTKAIMESATGKACDDLNLDPLQRKLQDLLQGKRYLLVLDDVWDDEQENWHKLKSVLACGGKGASVVVTTRLLKVAEIMGTMPPHDLSILSDDDCWELFKQKAFKPNEVEQEELVVIGKEIVKKCGGVPLAASALGSFLKFEREENVWLNVKESKLWSLEGENSVMPALRLSYLNLPVKLRQCFAFCAILPKDEIIKKDFLIELWMANGFIPSNEMLEAEDIGNKVCNELYRRSFFQDVETDELGKITSFKMHDLVHDLAQSVTEEVCCITNDNGVPSVSERTHHLLFHRTKSFGEVDSSWLRKNTSLKTFIMKFSILSIDSEAVPKKKSIDSEDQLSHHMLRCYSLRVLDLRGMNRLSSSIGYLKHLRYLNLSGGFFKTLPKSLCESWNLQILKLDNCYNLQKLPNSLTRLKALRHLSLRECDSLSSLPPNMGKLTSLRTLSTFVVGKNRGLLLAELGQLNLKGELYIRHLERVKSVNDAKEANMSRKHLNQLQLSWSRDEESQSQENVEQILEALQPAHTQQLQTLRVEGYTGAHFPQWMSSPSLKDLTSLWLEGCKSCLHLPQLGKLPSLKRLTINNMSHVKYLDEELYDGGVAGGFIALEYLSLQNMPSLIRLSMEDRENMFPHLSSLDITKCPNLLGFPDRMLSNLCCLKKLVIDNHSKLEVLTTEMINLGALEDLSIRTCESLKSLSDEVLQGLHSLKELYIFYCPKFKLSTGFRYLTCLESLEIALVSEVEEGFHEALQHMTALQFLALSGIPNLTSLPKCLEVKCLYLDSLPSLTSLPDCFGVEDLSLFSLPKLHQKKKKLTSLPDCLGNLGLLHGLEIDDCPNLTRLPMNTQCFSGLEILEVSDCPELVKRCQRETGEDWPKIAHVPRVIIE